jgi:uncharacterized protein YoxC
MPALSLDSVLDRLAGLQSELEGEREARTKLEHRTELLERTLERNTEDLDGLLEVAAAPAPASIGGRHARKLDRWLDGTEGRESEYASAKASTSHAGHAISRLQFDELRSAHQDLTQRIENIEHEINRRSRNEDAVHVALQELEESASSAATSAQLNSLETTLVTKANDASLEVASQAQRIDQLEEQLQLQGEEALERIQIEQQRRHEGLETSRAEMERIKKDLLNAVRSHHEIALGAVQRFKETAQEHLSSVKSNRDAGAVAAGRAPRLGPPRSSSPDQYVPGRSVSARIDQVPGRSVPGRSVPGRSGAPPGRSDASPGRPSTPNNRRRSSHQVQHRYQQQPSSEQRMVAHRAKESESRREESKSDVHATRGSRGDALGELCSYEREDSTDVASLMNSEYSYADTEEMSEADNHLYAQSDSLRHSVNEHIDYDSGDASRDGGYSSRDPRDHYEASHIDDRDIEQDGTILPLGERRRQLEEQRAAVEEKQFRLAAVTKALGRYSGQGGAQRRKA